MSLDADIRCPRCRWRPGPLARWTCLPDCAAAWNTFWTRGVCPACGRVWLETCCPACRAFSPHAAWYAHGSTGDHDEPGDSEDRQVGRRQDNDRG